MAIGHAERDYSVWRAAVDAQLLKKYLIDINMAGIDEDRLLSCFKNGETAREFVDWFGEKFGLLEDFP